MPRPLAPHVELRRSLGSLQATALVVGVVIGASIFVQPSEIMREVPSERGTLLAWLLAGVLTAAGALICAELASAFPRTGGVYVFLRRTIAPSIGFLWGWAMFWSMHSGIIAAVGMVFGRYAAPLTPWGDGAVRPLAVAAIVFVSGVNYFGVQHGGRLQAAFTIGKVAVIAGMIAVAFALGTPAAAEANAARTWFPGGPGAFGRAVAGGLFAFGGWHMVTYAAGETIDAARTIPRALVVGVAIVVACYVALNAAYLRVLPMETVIRSTRVAADAADAVLGTGGATFLSALVAFSSFGALAGVVLAGPRVYHSMAADGLAFRWIAAVHPRHRTPHRAIVLQAAWSCALAATGTYRALFTRVVYTEWIFFALMAVGLLRARRGPGYAPGWRIPGGPVLPALFIAGALFVVVVQVSARPTESVVGLGMVAVGLPVYLVWERAHAPDRRP